ncbi:hypothetical protein [Caballeronia sp. KNU42]
MSGQRVNNLIKYMSPNYFGFVFGAKDGFSTLAGDINDAGRTYSSTTTYQLGNFSADAAYTEVSKTALDISALEGTSKVDVIAVRYLRDWGAGASYALLKFVFYRVFSQVLYVGMEGQQMKLNYINYQTSFSYRATPSRRTNKARCAKISSVGPDSRLFFSVRTDVYAQAIIQLATGEG